MCQLPDCRAGGKLSPCHPSVIAGKLPQDGRIVEIGCGCGVLLSYLLGQGRDVTGVEPELGRFPPVEGARILAGRAEDLPLPDESCETAIMECVFSLCQPEVSVRELARILVPGGTAVIADMFSQAEGVTLHHSPMVRRVCPADGLYAYFQEGFTLCSFEDHTTGLRSMFLQAVLQGTAGGLLSPGDLQILKQAKAGYGIWIWKKRCCS